MYFCGENNKTGMGLGTGIVATGAAFLNYRSAKQDYDALVEKRDGLLSAVKMFNSQKDSDYLNYLDEQQEAQAITFPDDVKVVAVLRTAYLVGKMFRCIASLVFTNLSDKTYYISACGATCWVLDEPIIVKDLDKALSYFPLQVEAETIPQRTDKGFTLRPSETVEISFGKGVSAVTDMGALRQMVCDACGRRLITSCGKTSIEGGIKANIWYKWEELIDGKVDGKVKNVSIAQKPGVFRYCMELPLHKDS